MRCRRAADLQERPPSRCAESLLSVPLAVVAASSPLSGGLFLCVDRVSSRIRRACPMYKENLGILELAEASEVIRPTPNPIIQVLSSNSPRVEDTVLFFPGTSSHYLLSTTIQLSRHSLPCLISGLPYLSKAACHPQVTRHPHGSQGSSLPQTPAVSQT